MHKKTWQFLALSLVSAVLLAGTVLAQSTIVRTKNARGELAEQFSSHWLALTPDSSNSEIQIMLTFEPGNNQELESGMNFWVLDDNGLRKVLTGANNRLYQINLAAGARPANGQSNQRFARFQANGFTSYTIVVTNDSRVAASYTLDVEGATLVDESNQIVDRNAPVVAVQPEPDTTVQPAAETVVEVSEQPQAIESAAPASSETTESAVAQPAATRVPGVARGRELRGELVDPYSQHWLGLQPEQPNSTVVLEVEFDPGDNQFLRNGFNFYVLNQDGLRQVLNGGRMAEVNVAAGSRDSVQQNLLRARINSVNLEPYTIILFNNSTVPATYRIRTEKATLIDESGQTLTAQEQEPTTATGDSSAESAASPTSAGPVLSEGVSSVSSSVSATPAPSATPTSSATTTSRVTRQLRGELPDAMSQHWLALAPDQPNSTIILDLEFSPGDNQLLRNGFNFYVLNQDGLRKVLNGEQIGRVNIGAGTQELSLQANQRRIRINTVSTEPYTIIVHNTTNVPASYTLRVTGATLRDDSGQTEGFPTATSTPAADDAVSSAAGAGTGGPAAGVSALAVSGELVNVRDGPGLTYGILGTVREGLRFDVVGKDSPSEWWKICCISDLSGWIFGQLVTVENPERVPVAQNIPAAPAPVAQPAPAPSASDSSSDSQPGTIYVVQSGDTLSRIAISVYGDMTKAQEVCSFNNLADCNFLVVGQEIRLPNL